MKTITLEEAKANLAKFGKLCQKESVYVTVKGEPAFELVPCDDDDENFMDDLIATNAEFREMLEKRAKEKKEKTYTTSEILAHIDARERKEKRKSNLGAVKRPARKTA